jgi:sterol desaturase/sphingolipid hydroxylase (fatty acid hydroxylase superfamily)
MQEFLFFFETMPIWMKAFWIFLCIAVFWLLENSFSLFKLGYKKWKHASTNLILLAFVMIINAVFGVLLTLVFIWLKSSNFGLLQLFESPVWVKLLISILALDLIAQYTTHYILHKVKWMWRLHMVHHSDKNVDVTSGTRHHPLDFIFRELMALGAVVLLGMPVSF